MGLRKDYKRENYNAEMFLKKGLGGVTMEEIRIFRVDDGESYYIAAKNYLEAVTYFLNDCIGGEPPDGFDCEALSDIPLIASDYNALQRALQDRGLTDSNPKNPDDLRFKDLTGNLFEVPALIYSTI